MEGRNACLRTPLELVPLYYGSTEIETSLAGISGWSGFFSSDTTHIRHSQHQHSPPLHSGLNSLCHLSSQSVLEPCCTALHYSPRLKVTLLQWTSWLPTTVNLAQTPLKLLQRENGVTRLSLKAMDPRAKETR